MMQDVERVAKVVERTVIRLRELPDYAGRPAWDEIIREELTAAISAMTPDTALSHALHAGEDVGFARGWNAAIEAAAEACQSHPEEGSADLGPGIALAIEIIRALKSTKPPIL